MNTIYKATKINQRRSINKFILSTHFSMFEKDSLVRVNPKNSRSTVVYLTSTRSRIRRGASTGSPPRSTISEKMKQT